MLFNNRFKSTDLNKMIKRRDFLKTATVTATAVLTIPEIVSAALPLTKPSVRLNKDDVILFQGDSITDSGRNKGDDNFNTANHLGNGYAFHAAANLKIYNKGIGGNKINQLAERWEVDTLNLKPNVLSILVGVNDYWHKHTGNFKGTPAIFETDFRTLLEKTLERLPNVKIVIGEPFAVNHVKAVDDSWYPEFNEYRLATRKLAREFNTIYIPYQKVFDEAVKVAPAVYWTGDGVHPTVAGAKLMAEAWLQTTKLG